MSEKIAPGTTEDPRSDTLRIGVVLDGATVPAWIFHVLAHLDGDTLFDWCLTVTANQRPGARRTPSASIGVRMFEALDARRHAAEIDDALAARDATPTLEARELVELGRLAPVPLLGASHANGAGPLDVVLDLRVAPDGPPLTQLVGCDVWRAQPASDRHVGGDAIFWAIHDGRSECGVQVIVERSDGGGAEVLATAMVGLQPASLIVSKSLCYWKAAKLLTQQLGHLRDGRDAHVGAAQGAGNDAYESASALRPRSSAASRVAGRQLVAAVRHRRERRATRGQWVLGLRRRTHDTLALDATGFHPILPPSDRTYADPFLIEHDSESFLFLEEYEFAHGRGVISVTTLGEDGAPGTPEVVLERPYHLSYPFVFHDHGDYFMIPETAANRTIELYRATDFPRAWSLEEVLFDDVRALDSTLITMNGRYWLLTCIEEPGRNRNDELHVFSSATLRGPWTPHARNPVVSDVRCARPAGRPFFMGSSLIRPAQDCSLRYGSAIVFRRVDVLSERDYVEETVAILPPTWAAGLLGTHTFANQGLVDIVDGRRRIPRLGSQRRHGLRELRAE